MSTKLPPDLDAYVREKLASGEYASADEVLVQALRVMRNVEKMIPSADDDLRRELDLGLQDVEAGRVSEWNVEELKEELRSRAGKVTKKKAS